MSRGGSVNRSCVESERKPSCRLPRQSGPRALSRRPGTIARRSPGTRASPISWISMIRMSTSSCVEQFLFGGNMTNVMAALVNIANTDCLEQEDALNFFYERWKNDPRGGQVARYPGNIAPAEYARTGKGTDAPSRLQYQKSEQGPRPHRRLPPTPCASMIRAERDTSFWPSMS